MAESFGYQEREHEHQSSQPLQVEQIAIQSPEQQKTPEQAPQAPSTEELLLKKIGKLKDIPQIKTVIDQLLQQTPTSAEQFFIALEAINTQNSDQEEYQRKSLRKRGKLDTNKTDQERSQQRNSIKKITAITSSLSQGKALPSDLESFSKNINLTQELAKLADLWTLKSMETQRGSLDQERIAKKQDKFLQLINTLHPHQQHISPEEIQKKSDSVGRLTFEVFLDDFFNSPDLQPEKNQKLPTLNELYQNWESFKINETSKVLWSEQFAQALKDSTSNLWSYKQKAYAAVQKINADPDLSPEQKQEQIAKIHETWLLEARNKGELLNRHELICAALGKDFTLKAERTEYFRILQHIGRHFFNEADTVVDGKWGPQTQTILQRLIYQFESSNESKFQKVVNNLKKLLSQQKQFDIEERLKATQKEENIIRSTFDSIPPLNKETLKNKLEGNTLNTDNIKLDQQTKKTEQSSLNIEGKTDLITQVSPEQAENSIPQDIYLAMLQNFLNHDSIKNYIQKKAPGTDLKQLAQELMGGNGGSEIYQTIKAQRDKSNFKQSLVKQFSDKINQDIRDKATQTALQAGKEFFQSFGINIKGQKVDPRGQYLIFSDEQGKEYYYRPSSGKFSTQVPDTIHRDKKSIETWGNYTILMSIPTLDKLITQAKDLSYLPKERCKNNNELTHHLEQGLKNQISHTVGTVERSLIQETIKTQQEKSEIITIIKDKILKYPWTEINQEKNPLYYEMLLPVINTLQKAKPHELTQLKNFLQLLEKSKWEAHEKPDPIKNAAHNLKPQALIAKTPKELGLLISRPDEFTKMEQKVYQKSSETGIGKLLTGLSKVDPGEWPEYLNLDFKKIQILMDNRENPTITHPESQKIFSSLAQNIGQSYIKQAGALEKWASEEEAEKTLKKLE